MGGPSQAVKFCACTGCCGDPESTADQSGNFRPTEPRCLVLLLHDSPTETTLDLPRADTCQNPSFGREETQQARLMAKENVPLGVPVAYADCSGQLKWLLE